MSPEATETVYWEYIVSVPARGASGYGYTVSTTADSMPGLIPYSVFFVDAQETTSSTFYVSDPDSGYSVDNLAPAPPTSFAGQYASPSGVATLHWNVGEAPDFATFKLYRGKSPDFVPGPDNLRATLADTGFVDTAGTAYYYKLSAVDVHGNESGYALLLPSGAVGVEDPRLPARIWLGPAVPNPMAQEALIRFDLPVAGPVRLTLYDLRGRQVRVLCDGEQPAGEQVARWDGRDAAGRAVPSGLYLFRLEAMGKSLTGRLAKVN
jgi:hypothetical protein